MFGIKLIKAERLRRFLVILFYLGFAVTMIYCFLHTDNSDDKVLYILLCVFIPFGLWYEMIRYKYTKCNDYLHDRCCPNKVLRLTQFIYKYDIFKRYKLQTMYLEGFALIDLARMEDAKNFILKSLDRLAGTGKKLNFEYNYLNFMLWTIEKDRKEVQIYYTSLKKIFSMNKNSNENILSLKYMVDGIYCYTNKQYKNAKMFFDRVKSELLGKHECAWYYFYFSKILYENNEVKNSTQYFLKACEMAPDIKIFTK